MIGLKSTCTDAFKLPFAVDASRLAEDAERLVALPALPQPGPHHKGEWMGIAFHSAGGAQSAAGSFPSLEPYQFTREADQAPYLKQFLSSLPFPLEVARVLSLPAGGAIGTHVDFDTNFQFGLVRLHVPLQTNPDVEFLISGRYYQMQVGEVWYGDFSKPHQVANRGSEVRLHAVVDVEINDALLSLLPVEYVQRQSELGPISKHREPLKASEDLGSFACRFFLPGTVLPLLVLGRLVEMVRGASAEVHCRDDELVLYLDGQRCCKLERVAEDELGFMGFPPGCFLRFRRSNGKVVEVKLVVRGVQEDLVAARVGVLHGERIPERDIALDLA